MADIVFHSTSLRPAGLCHGPVLVNVLIFISNISKTAHPIFIKLHRNDPVMALLRLLERIHFLQKLVVMSLPHGSQVLHGFIS